MPYPASSASASRATWAALVTVPSWPTAWSTLDDANAALQLDDPFPENNDGEDWYGDFLGFARHHHSAGSGTGRSRSAGRRSRRAAPTWTSDGDGVNNCDDKCPGSQAGQTIGPDGCPVPVSIDLKGVNFDFDKATLRPDAIAILERGHRDPASAIRSCASRSPATPTRRWHRRPYNQALSERRGTCGVRLPDQQRHRRRASGGSGGLRRKPPDRAEHQRGRVRTIRKGRAKNRHRAERPELIPARSTANKPGSPAPAGLLAEDLRRPSLGRSGRASLLVNGAPARARITIVLSGVNNRAPAVLSSLRNVRE